MSNWKVPLSKYLRTFSNPIASVYIMPYINPIYSELKSPKCGWEVAKASQDARFTDLGSQLAFDFLPGDARGEDMKRPSRASVNEKKSILSMVKLSLVAIMKNKNE